MWAREKAWAVTSMPRATGSPHGPKVSRLTTACIVLALAWALLAAPAALAGASHEGSAGGSVNGQGAYIYHKAEANPTTYATQTIEQAYCRLLSPPCMPHTYPPLVQGTAEVWEEANACSGLQREAVDCDDDGHRERSDRLVERVEVTAP